METNFILSSPHFHLVLLSVSITPRRSFRISDIHSQLPRSLLDPHPRPCLVNELSSVCIADRLIVSTLDQCSEAWELYLTSPFSFMSTCWIAQSDARTQVPRKSSHVCDISSADNRSSQPSSWCISDLFAEECDPTWHSILSRQSPLLVTSEWTIHGTLWASLPSSWVQRPRASVPFFFFFFLNLDQFFFSLR